MEMLLRFTFLFAAIFCASPAIYCSQNQQPDIETVKKSAPKVFIDCDYCDLDYIKTEITFVNYVRDRLEAQIHVLITTQPTGSSGTEYTLAFSGQKEFAGHDDVFKYASGGTDTSDERRKGLVRTLKIGLISYVGKTPMADRISISLSEKTKPTSVEDKWNFWVFSLSGSGYFNGEKMYRSHSIYGSMSANRVTPAFKFRSSISAYKSTDRYTTSEGDVISTSKDKYFSALLVKSINNHWSVGTSISAGSSTYSNTKLYVRPAPAVEFDLFPYSESTRRQLRFMYKPGYSLYHYHEETIFNKISEGIWGESFSATLELKEKWGTISNSVEGYHLFSDLRKNHIQTDTELSIRLFKGLSFRLYGSFSRIHDRLSLIKGDASLEDVLLRRTQLATSYSYYGSIGLSYTFGSIYSNVVNPRFGGN
jgi:hypothetical protein